MLFYYLTSLIWVLNAKYNYDKKIISLFTIITTIILSNVQTSNAEVLEQQIYHELLDTIKQNYYDTSFNNQNLDAWYKKYDGKIKTKDDLIVAGDSLTNSLNDDYTVFYSPKEYTNENKYMKRLIIFNKEQVLSSKPFLKTPKIPKNIAYIRINSFINQNTSILFYRKMLSNKNKEGLIIDLRYNSGGMVKMAAEIANMFISGGIIVSEDDRDGNIKPIKASEQTLKNTPVVILVNNYTASASEVFAGAMQDRGRAQIVGTNTFGKGIVQKHFGLNGGYGVKMTIAKYYTPSNKCIHKIGIKPDYVVEYNGGDFDNQLETAIKILQDEIKNWFCSNLISELQQNQTQMNVWW